MKKIFIGIFLLILLIVAILLITKNTVSEEEKKFIGTWKSQDDFWTYKFFLNKTCSINGKIGEWEVSDGKIIIKFDNGHRINTNSYQFSNDNRELRIAGLTLIKINT